MDEFSLDVKTNCVIWYGNSLSIAQTLRRYRTHYGQHALAPSRPTIRNWYQKFRETGSVNNRKRRFEFTIRTPQTIQNVIQTVQANPHSSLRRLSLQTGVSVTSVYRILQSQKFHPYKLQIVQQLLPGDLVARTEFSQAQILMHAQNQNFYDFLVFSDESHFHLNGAVNTHNCRYWSDENPHWYTEVPLHSPRVTVWAAIGRPLVLGPYFIEGNVNGNSYLALLQNHVVPALQNHQNFQHLMFQQDGAPPHWTLAVRNYLNLTLPGRWIGRGSPFLPWPPRSPDLSPMDFFLWGYVKSQVYNAPLANLEELRQRIVNTFANLPMDMVDRSIASYERRLGRCVQIDGRNVEVR